MQHSKAYAAYELCELFDYVKQTLLLLSLPSRIISNYIRHSSINIINLQKGRLTDKQATTALRRRCNLFAMTGSKHTETQTERLRERETEGGSKRDRQADTRV